MAAARVAAALVALSALASSCSRGPEPTPRIGVVASSIDEPLFAAARPAMARGAAGLAELEFADSLGQGFVQSRNVDSLIKRRCKALVVSSVDALSARSAIASAKAKGVPLVFLGVRPAEDSMRSWDKVFFVGSNDAEAGRTLGDMLADRWKADKAADFNGDRAMQLVIIAGEPGVPETYVRADRVVKALSAAGIKVDKLVEASAQGKRAEAKEKMAAALAAFPGRIEAVACTDGEAAIGALEACEAIGGKRRVPLVVGVYASDGDSARRLDEALASGRMLGAARLDETAIGEAAMSLALALSRSVEPSQAGLVLDDAKFLWVPFRRIERKPAAGK